MTETEPVQKRIGRVCIHLLLGLSFGLCAILPSLLAYLVSFGSGFGLIAQSLDFLTAILLFLIGPLLSIILFLLVARSIPDSSIVLPPAAKVAASACLFLLHYLCFFGLFPPAATAFSEGLVARVALRSRDGRLQQWATQALARYRAKELRTTGEAAYYSGGSVELAKEEVPPLIRNLWSRPPTSVSVLVSESDTPECIVVSWYLHGALIGPPDYKVHWQTFYFAGVRPGIYVYHRIR